MWGESGSECILYQQTMGNDKLALVLYGVYSIPKLLRYV